MSGAETIAAAIARVVEVVRGAEARQRERSSTAIATTAALVRSRAPELVIEARAAQECEREQARIDPVDPDALEWDPFELFGNQSREPAWTQWLAACLRAEHGSALAKLMWRSICDAVVRADHPVDVDDVVATVADWQHVRDAPPVRVLDEVGDPEGRPDTIVYTERFVLVLENKLYARWHDRSDGLQATSYEALGRRRAHAARTNVALVLLTCREKMPAPPPWIVITYERLAVLLRVHLREALSAGSSAIELARLLPALVTVRAIERHLVGVPAPPKRTDDPVTELLEHLRHQRATEGLR